MKTLRLLLTVFALAFLISLVLLIAGGFVGVAAIGFDLVRGLV